MSQSGRWFCILLHYLNVIENNFRNVCIKFSGDYGRILNLHYLLFLHRGLAKWIMFFTQWVIRFGYFLELSNARFPQVDHPGNIGILLSLCILGLWSDGRLFDLTLSHPSNPFSLLRASKYLLLFLPIPDVFNLIIITSGNNTNPGTILQFATRLETMVLIHLVNILDGKRVLE